MSKNTPAVEQQPAWEIITGSGDNTTARLAVPGGHIYRSMCSPFNPGEFAVALVFVPEQLVLGVASEIRSADSICRFHDGGRAQ